MTDTILKFSTSWCLPCNQMNSALDGIDLGVPMTSHDVDNEQDKELARFYQVRSIPTLIRLKDGVEVARLKGFDSLEVVKNWIQSN